MSGRFPWKGHRYWLAVVFFMVAGVPGLWFPALSNILVSGGLGGWKEIAFMLPSIAGILSPLVFAAQVDQRFEAQKVLGWIMIIGSVFLFLAFHSIEAGWGGPTFLVFFAVNALISVPAWSLLNTVALASLDDPGKSFGLFRVWGTIGWMLAGLLISWLVLDFSPMAGKLAAGFRIVAGLACFCLKPVEPRGAKPKSLAEALGFGAFKIFKDRDQCVYFLTAFLFHIPLASFYLHTPMHFREMGVERVSAMMSTGQILEIFAMLLMGTAIAKFRVKQILFTALLLGVMRYGLCAAGAHFNDISWLIVGVMLHGITWTFFVEAGRVFLDRRVDRGVRAQAQALMGFVTSGVAGVLGVLTVKFLHARLVLAEGAPGWSAYWTVLSGLCLLSLLLFGIGYRGKIALPER